MKNMHLAAVVFIALAARAIAQTAPPPPPEPGPNMLFIQQGGDGEAIHFFSAEMMGSRELVKGAPYTATTVIETTQVLADGNRIVNKRGGSVARDSEGRVRREETLGRIGPFQVDAPKMIFIHDPVAKRTYVLNTNRQVAHVMTRDGAEIKVIQRLHQSAREHSGAEGKRSEMGEVKRESLGTQQIEGITAEGNRITRTIPAGTIGNEKPIEITVESWTSPDLHTLVLQKRSDPRFGETVFRLTNIKRGEPDTSLFQIPAGYKTMEGPAAPVAPPPPGD